MSERFIQLKQRIMRRVYFIYLLRKALSPKAVKLYIIALVAFELSPFSPFISIEHVIANMPRFSDVPALLNFNLTAFLHTNLFIQMSLLAFALVCASFIYDALRVLGGRSGQLSRA